MFEYEVPIYGCRRIRGGQVIDFVVFNPFANPVLVHGEYWHKTFTDLYERWKLMMIERKYKKAAIIFWGDDLETQAEATETVRRAFG